MSRVSSHFLFSYLGLYQLSFTEPFFGYRLPSLFAVFVLHLWLNSVSFVPLDSSIIFGHCLSIDLRPAGALRNMRSHHFTLGRVSISSPMHEIQFHPGTHLV